MNTSNALRVLVEYPGTRVRRPIWGPGEYLESTPEGIRNQFGTLVSAIYIGDDWEMYQEQGHCWMWASEQLVMGNAVRRLAWALGTSIDARSDGRIIYYSPIDDLDAYAPTVQDIKALDWVKASQDGVVA